MISYQAGHFVLKNGCYPTMEFSLAGTTECLDTMIGLNACLLDDVGGIELRREHLLHGTPGDQPKIRAVLSQQRIHRVIFASTDSGQ